jgi:hypothetical protein
MAPEENELAGFHGLSVAQCIIGQGRAFLRVQTLSSYYGDKNILFTPIFLQNAEFPAVLLYFNHLSTVREGFRLHEKSGSENLLMTSLFFFVPDGGRKRIFAILLTKKL